MLSHLTGEIVEIVGINSNTNGCSCEEHHTCGCVLEEDTLVRLQKCQVYINGHEQSAVGVYWVLHCHQVKHLNKLEGALCQLTEVYSDNSDSPTKQHKHKKNFDCAIVAIVSSNKPNKVRNTKKQITKSSQNSYKCGYTYKHQFNITKAKEIPWTCNRKEQTYKE